MRWRDRCLALGFALALLPMSAALAADHRDGAAVLTDPSTDLNDVYSWVSGDGSKVYLIMTAFPAADRNASKFSTAAYYVFHTASRPAFSAPAALAKPFDIICSFDAAQRIRCWVGNNTRFIEGDASNTNGLTSEDKTFRIFAGPREDHFFFNLDGFNRVRNTVKGLNPVPTANNNGCFAMSANNAGGLTPAQTMVVRQQLMQNSQGGAATDFFGALNTLAIVVEIDRSIVTAGGQFLSVYGATYKK